MGMYKLTGNEKIEKYKTTLFEAECSCGKISWLSKVHLSYNKFGCRDCLIKYRKLSSKPRTHPLFAIYSAMIFRCSNPKNKAFRHYGGRGITVSRSWVVSFDTFCQDMGPRPSKGHSLDRKNNNEGYSKENCRWATQKEQCNNTRNNRLIDGETVSQMAERLAIPYNTLYSRLFRGPRLKRNTFIYQTHNSPHYK